MPDFATRLRQLRRQNGLTRYRVGKLAGLSTQGISNLERRGSDPKLSTLYKLAHALGVSIEELVRDEDEPAKSKRTQKRK
jgi:transcriptional regulator with XRE-family HTH domain